MCWSGCVLPMSCLMCTDACRSDQTDVVCENSECFGNNEDSAFVYNLEYLYLNTQKKFNRKETICSVCEKVILSLKFIGKTPVIGFALRKLWSKYCNFNKNGNPHLSSILDVAGFLDPSLALYNRDCWHVCCLSFWGLRCAVKLPLQYFIYH